MLDLQDPKPTASAVVAGRPDPSKDAQEKGRRGFTRSAFLKRSAMTGVAASVATLALEACGGGGAPKTASASATTTQGAGPSGPVTPNLGSKYKNKTIGFAMLTASDENILSIVRWAKRAASDAGLNWSWDVTDTQGTLQGAQTALGSYITRKVDGIMMVGVGASQIEPQLAQAKSAGIPTLGSYTFAPLDSSISNDFTLPPDTDASLLGNYLISDQLERRRSGTIKVAMLDFSADVIQARRYAFEGLVAQQPRFQIVARDFNISTTNTVSDSTSAARTIIQAHPDLSAIWCNYPPIAVPAASGVAQSGKTGIQVYGHIANSSGVEAVRSGSTPLIATSWVDWPYLGYMLVDQMLNAISGKKLDRKQAVLNPDPSIVFSASNVSQEVPKGTKAGDWMFAGGTYRAQFLKNWNTQFA